MTDATFVALTVLKAIVLALGSVFLTVTWRAYRRERNGAMLTLFAAIALMTAAALAEGAAIVAVGLDLDQAHLLEAVFTVAAFAVLVWSVLGGRVRRKL